jgi:GntR family transcriptional regulator / MocR family aminotransferase
MPKRATSAGDSGIRLDQRASTPLHRQIYDRVRGQILAGQLVAGSRLPSTRGLAAELGISRTTTALAYQMLQLEGYIESRVGAGAHVARVRVGQQPAKRSSPGVVGIAFARPQEPPPATATIRRYDTRRVRAFSAGIPDVTHFPWETWARLTARHARHSLQGVAQGLSASGYLPLRAAIAAHIAVTRGVSCGEDDVIITAGSQGALHLIAQTLLAPGDRVWMEDPGYHGTRGALRTAGVSVLPVPVDAAGLDVLAGIEAMAGARLAVVTPSHQFPTGVTMSLGRRVALLEWAATTHGWIVEDDYDSEYCYGGRPLESLQGLDRGERVIYVGTFSKTLFPALRLGYLVAPAKLRERLLTTRALIDSHHPALDQMALADFMAAGHYARHVRRMRELYRERRDTLINALASACGGALDVSAPQAGLHLVAWLATQLDARQVAPLDLGIEMVSHYAKRPLARDGLVLGYATATPDELRAGVSRLARVLRPTSGEPAPAATTEQIT